MYNNSFYPYMNYGVRPGLFSRLSSTVGNTVGKAKFNWSGLLNGTQKTLNIINQAIPVFYQIKPIYNNAKTVFRVMGAMKSPDTSTIHKTSNRAVTTEDSSSFPESSNRSSASRNPSNTSPTFFL